MVAFNREHDVKASNHILRAGLYFIGIAAILIGSAIAMLGIHLVGPFFSAIVN